MGAPLRENNLLRSGDVVVERCHPGRRACVVSKAASISTGHFMLLAKVHAVVIGAVGQILRKPSAEPAVVHTSEVAHPSYARLAFGDFWVEGGGRYRLETSHASA